MPANIQKNKLVSTLNDAKKAAGPDIIIATLFLPIVLILAFSCLLVYMRSGQQELARSFANSIV